MSNHRICSKVDRAIVAYIIADGGAGTADDVWPAKRSLNKTVGGTIVWSHSAEPPSGDMLSGNRLVECFIEVRMPGVITEEDSDTAAAAASDARVGATFDLFNAGLDSASDKLGEAITAAARASTDADLKDLTIQSCRVVGESQGFNPRNPRMEGQMWVDVLHLELLCSPSDVS